MRLASFRADNLCRKPKRSSAVSKTQSLREQSCGEKQPGGLFILTWRLSAPARDVVRTEKTRHRYSTPLPEHKRDSRSTFASARRAQAAARRAFPRSGLASPQI